MRNETAGAYSWTYAGTTVRYGDTSWQYHEPDTYRPKALTDRFYNELSPQHVSRLLKRKGREHLELAAHVAYMRRAHSDEARALADLLTRQCIERYSDHCRPDLFEWRAKLLIEQGRAADAVALLKQRFERYQGEPPGRDRLLKALQRAEGKAQPTARRRPPRAADKIQPLGLTRQNLPLARSRGASPRPAPRR